ncbi:MAG: MerR family transcriptional regulator [Pseudomonadota bacterium]
MTASEVGKSTGLTIKALRLYERHGLIHPARTPAGWRSYDDKAIARLQKIQVLKRMGLRLAEMRDVLNDGVALHRLLRAQEVVLASRQLQLTSTLAAIRRALLQLESGEALSLDDLISLLKETHAMNEQNWSEADRKLADRHYSTSQLEQIVQHKQADQFDDEVADIWDSLIRDIDAAQGEPPDSPIAQELARRWRDASLAFHEGDEALMAITENWYRDGYADPATADSMPFPRHIWEFASSAVRCMQDNEQR